MYFNLQLPFLDIRNFLQTYHAKFFNPSLFVCNNTRPFYRRFGQQQDRKIGQAVPSSESQYIESKNAIKFNEDFLKLRLRNVTERLFVDKYVVHFDIGLRTYRKQDMSYKEFKDFYKKILESKIFVQDAKKINFVELTKSIAGKYQRATTYHKYSDIMKENKIVGGDPIIFIEYSNGEINNFPKTLYEYKMGDNLDFKFDAIHVNGIPTYVWFIKKGSRSENSQSRQMRIALSKIHHNQMSMNKFVKWFEMQDKSQINEHETLDYIDEMLKIIRKQKKSTERSEIYNEAIKIYGIINEQRVLDSNELLGKFREELLKIKKETEKGITKSKFLTTAISKKYET